MGQHTTAGKLLFYKSTTMLTGNSRDRRKQLRKLQKQYPNCVVEGSFTYKTLNGKRVAVEDANIPRTRVLLKS